MKIKKINPIWITLILIFYTFNCSAENIDELISEKIYDNFSSPLSQSVMREITQLGDGKGIILLSSSMMFTENENLHRLGKLSLFSYTLSGFSTVALKLSVDRTRPDGRNHSFPSGHTSTVFAVATIISYEYPDWRIPAYSLAGAVGLSRIALGRHYVGDVLAGAAIGIASGWVVEKFSSKLLSL